MMNPFVSIIIPVYNAEKFLHRCIDSVLVQTFTNFELLLIDDGSTDSSGVICDEYSRSDARVRVFHKNNGGVSTARNLGLDNATGEWIAFMDADDWVESDWLFVANRIVQSHQIEIIRFGYKIENNGEIEIVSHTCDELVENSSTLWRKCIENRYYGYLWNTVFKRSCLGSVRFDESLRLCEDHIFTNTVVHSLHKMYISTECFYHYIKGQTISLSNVSDPYIIYDAGIQSYLTEIRFIGSEKDLKDRVLSVYHHNMNGAIATAYKFSTRNERRVFARQFTLQTKEGVTLFERIFACKCIPFFIKDILFQLKYWIRS